MYTNKVLSVPVSILNPKAYYVIYTTNIGLILLSKI